MISSLPTLAKAVEQIQSGELAPLELVEHCLGRIRQFEDRVHAWVLVDEEGARREAERQAELLREGIALGPLAGIPIGIKDIIDVAGWPTRAGSRLREGHVAERDATLVKRLRRAGAILLGKTVTTEFACFDPPPTRNPWNLERTPGGSSSGSAAAVALEMCLAAIGTQTGGSIIRPASYCGVCGLKPSHGSVPLDGVVPLSPHLDHAGPITRCVQDLCRVYEVLAGLVLRDVSSEVPPPASHWQTIPGFFLTEADPEVQGVTRQALGKLEDALAAPRPLRLPASFADVHANHWRVMAVDAAVYHREPFAAAPHAYGPRVSQLIKDGLASSGVDYAAALAHQQRFRREIDELFAGETIAVIPSTPNSAPGLDSTGDPKFNSPWSYAGVPTVTIPCGLTDAGLPCGLQLVGPRNEERRLLQLAAWCEAQLHFDRQPPLLTA